MLRILKNRAKDWPLRGKFMGKILKQVVVPKVKNQFLDH